MSIREREHRFHVVRAAVAYSVAVCAAVVVVKPIFAAPVTLSGSADHLAASVTFDTSGNDLIVTLTSTSSSDVMVPNDVLTTVFFDVDLPEPVSLTPVSAVLGPGSSVLFGGTDPGGVVGGEWAYADNLSGAPADMGYGISSAGLDLFGPHDRFPGDNLQGPASPGGIQYGITSAGDDPTTGNTPVTGKNALIQNEVICTLSGLPGGFDPAARITNVSWQYGTGFDGPGFFAPEPASLSLLVLGGLAAMRRRRQQAPAPNQIDQGASGWIPPAPGNYAAKSP